MAHYIQHLMNQYGYWVLGIALFLEMLALPLPGEVLMTYTGLMIFHGQLNWFLSILTAVAGAAAGMTLSYGIGYRLGHPFFEKYGAKVHLGPDKLEKTSQWFEQYGNKLLIITYFIPGVRHFTGYFSGVTRMPLRTYMLYSYTGALLWTGTFISLGKILGPKWERFHHSIMKYLLIAALVVAVIFAAVYVYKKYKNQLSAAVMTGIDKGVNIFHSLRRVRALILISFVIFLALFIFMAKLIQDLLGNEFADFDTVTAYMVHAAFDESWSAWMHGFEYLSSLQVLLVIVTLAVVWILITGKNRLLDITFLLYVLIGGQLWDEGLRRLFHRAGPGNLLNTFPSQQTFITIIFLGFTAYLFIQHVNRTWIRTSAVVLVLAVSLLVGISRIYFGIQFPSDVLAGYVFGGVWLSFNAVLLEIFRLIKKNKLNFLT